MVSSKLILIMIAMCTGIAVSVAGYLESNPGKPLHFPVTENCIETPHGTAMLPLVESLMPIETDSWSKPTVERFVRQSKNRSRTATNSKPSQTRVRTLEIKVETSESGQPTIGVIETYL